MHDDAARRVVDDRRRSATRGVSAGDDGQALELRSTHALIDTALDRIARRCSRQHCAPRCADCTDGGTSSPSRRERSRIRRASSIQTCGSRRRIRETEPLIACHAEQIEHPSSSRSCSVQIVHDNLVIDRRSWSCPVAMSWRGRAQFGRVLRATAQSVLRGHCSPVVALRLRKGPSPTSITKCVERGLSWPDAFGTRTHATLPQIGTIRIGRRIVGRLRDARRSCRHASSRVQCPSA